MLIGTLTMNRNGCDVEKQEVAMNRRDVQEEIDEFKNNGWKSESVFLLNGNVEVKLYGYISGTVHGIKWNEKAAITGTLIESEKNKMFSIYK